MANKLFNLEERVPVENMFPKIDNAREYDVIMRKTALVPYQKAGNAILDICKPKDRVLDVGFGIGLVSFYIGGKNPKLEIFGVEEHEHLFEVATDNLNLCHWGGAKSEIEFEKCELEDLPYDDNSFDVVYSYASLHLWKNPVKVLKECTRVCKEGGTIVIQDFNRHAEEGYISFVLQFVQDGAENFMSALRAGYNSDEVIKILEEAGLSDWNIYLVDLDLILSNKELDI